MYCSYSSLAADVRRAPTLPLPGMRGGGGGGGCGWVCGGLPTGPAPGGTPTPREVGGWPMARDTGGGPPGMDAGGPPTWPDTGPGGGRGWPGQLGPNLSCQTHTHIHRDTHMYNMVNNNSLRYKAKSRLITWHQNTYSHDIPMQHDYELIVQCTEDFSLLRSTVVILFH